MGARSFVLRDFIDNLIFEDRVREFMHKHLRAPTEEEQILIIEAITKEEHDKRLEIILGKNKGAPKYELSEST